MTEISAYEYYLYLKGNYLFFQEETETQNLIFTYQWGIHLNSGIFSFSINE